MTNTPETNPSPRLPSYIAYQVRDREGKKGVWTRIGAAYAHADGQGINIQLECVPLDGRVTLRLPSENS